MRKRSLEIKRKQRPRVEQTLGKRYGLVLERLEEAGVMEWKR